MSQSCRRNLSKTQSKTIFITLILLLSQFQPILTQSSLTKQTKNSSEEQVCLQNQSQVSCKECIKAGQHCAWWEKGLNPDTSTKCFYHKKGADFDGPLDESKAISPPESIASQKLGISGNQGYLSPAELSLKLRPGASGSVKIQFTVHHSYPVDLYYLFDLSGSMKAYISKVGKASNDIAEALSQEIGDDLRMGVGSFIEKPTAPFTNNGGQHVFKHWMSFEDYENYNGRGTKNDFLKNEIDFLTNQTKSNNDAEEAGLEALSQVAVCKDKIGWKQEAKHLLIFSTDAASHLAGDGRLAGINKPNELVCALSEKNPKYVRPTSKEKMVAKNEYLDGLKQDYPSVHDVKNVMNEQNIQTIFALSATKEECTDIYSKDCLIDKANAEKKNLAVQKFYEDLVDVIGDGNQVVVTDKNTDLPKILVDTYKAMTKSVSLNVVGIPQDYEYKIDTKCYLNGQTESVTFKNSSVCADPKKPINNSERELEKDSSKVTFTLEIKLAPGKCPPPAEVFINTPGYGGTAKVKLVLESNCDCDTCKPYENFENEFSKACPNSAKECSGNGEFNCGKCVCDEGWGGDCCDCKLGDAKQELEYQKSCYPDGTDKICSGRGQCQCGKCVCETNTLSTLNIFGEHCQCTLDSCPKVAGVVCNNKGNCQCGKCICDSGWSGKDCGCEDSSSKCEDNCNGNGECRCNKCDCNKDENGLWTFTGNSCDGFELVCDNFQDCVDGDCDLAAKVDKIKDGVNVKKCNYDHPKANVCEFTGEIEQYSLTFFVDGNLKFVYDTESSCQKPINVALVLFWTIGSTILLGLLIIIAIKIIIEWLNYKEYKTLENQEINAVKGDGYGEVRAFD